MGGPAWIRLISGLTCNRFIWGSEPIEAYSDGRVQCGCPRGSESYRGECVRADLYGSPFAGHIPLGIEGHLIGTGIGIDAIAIGLTTGFIATDFRR